MDGSASPRRELVIVALPSENDPVRKYSSEKEPHLTLLYLGENKFDSSELKHVTDYVEHASSMFYRCLIEVDRRGVLGDQNADVLFFNNERAQQIATLRQQLLRDPLISTAYLSTDQFPDWTPHLTMGYPASPAMKDARDNPGFFYVDFDRIALWTDDYSGPTFQLKNNGYGMEVAMSQIERGRSVTDDVLQHHGVKGMKWGVRRSDSSNDSSTRSADSKAAVDAQSKIKSSGTKSLSNQELQGLINRMNLERQYQTMVSQNQTSMDRGLQTTQKILKAGKTVEDVRRFLDTPTGKAVKAGIKAAVKVGGAYATGGTSAAAGAGASLVVRRPANHYTNTGR